MLVLGRSLGLDPGGAVPHDHTTFGFVAMLAAGPGILGRANFNVSIVNGVGLIRYGQHRHGHGRGVYTSTLFRRAHPLPTVSTRFGLQHGRVRAFDH